jgi:hypothetical protein
VNTPEARCKSVYFYDESSKLTLGNSSVLNVYGNFNLATTTHTAFSGWASGAKLKFKGNEQQTINNLNTSTTSTAQTFFMEIQIDKNADTLKIPKGDVKLNIGTSLEILNGTLLIDSTSDIQGRNFDGTIATIPTITVYNGGAFTMSGGGSHIGSGTTGTPRPPIGKVTVYGQMTVVTTSTNLINFNGIDVEAGGQLNFPTGWSSARLNPGTLTVKNGGIILHSTTTNFWATGAALVLQNGSVYKTTASNPTTFPVNITNNGTVRYQRTASGDQAISDMDYYRLEISFSGNNKVWTLSANRVIADSLEINNSATLVLAGSGTPMVNGILRLTTGTLNNLSRNIALANGATISRATGTISTAPIFGANVNVRYTSISSNVTTGPEIPTSPSILKDLQIITETTTVTLSTNTTLNGILTLSNGIFDNNGSANDKTLTLADAVTIRRATGVLTSPPVFGASVNLEYMSTVADVTTGFEVPLSPSILNNLTLTTSKIVTLSSDVTVNGTLALTNSQIKTDIYALTVNGSITGVSPNNFINGNLSLPVSTGGIKKWEIGQDVDYLPLIVEFDSITGSDKITSTVLDKNLTPLIFPVQPTDKILKRYFRVYKGSGISSFEINSLTLAYSDSDVVEQELIEDDLRVFYYNDSGWYPLNIISKDPIANTITVVDVDAFTDFIIAGNDIQTLICKDIQVTAGWNLISTPTRLHDMSATTLFPTATSVAYSFSQGYIKADTLENSKGYWLKFSSPQIVTICGKEVELSTISVTVGWNLISIYDTNIEVNQITSTPDGILKTPFYGYTNGYFVSPILESGKGYWIKVSEAGIINIP